MVRGRGAAGLLAVVALVVGLLAVAPAGPAGATTCSTTRLAVQTGADAGASSVVTTPVRTTAAALGTVPTPALPLPATRVAPTETTVYEVSATMVGYQLGSGGDLRLYLRDPTGQPLVADIPDPTCVAASSPFAAAIAAVRTAFSASYSASSTVTTVNVPVLVSGVGYFDATGDPQAAPNGVALHPVLSLQLNQPLTTVDRIGGANRYETAALASTAAFPSGASVVFVASGAGFPDALAGGAAAGARHAPVLLVQPDAVPAATATALDRLAPTTLEVLGGPGAVSDAVLAALAAPGRTVHRIAGPDRFTTAAMVSAATFAPKPADLFVATGRDFPDALAGSAAAGALGVPLLLVDTDQVPAATAQEVKRLQPARITVLGGTGVVSAAVQTALQAYAPTRRLAGASRYATAALVAASAFPTASRTYLATGSGFADALAGGPAAAAVRAPVLLTQPGCLPAEPAAQLARLDPSQVTLLGGTGALGAGAAQLAPCATDRPVPYVGTIPVAAGCITLTPAIVGVKVYLVQKALGLVGHNERYDAATVAAVKAFQQRKRLPVTGLVDRATWEALGTGYDFCLDRYTAQPTVAPAAPVADHVAALLAFASAQAGRPYIYGGAGPIGYDCSGLALQAMYSAGRTFPGITTDLHVQASFATAAVMYHSTAMLHVPLAQRRPGDLVFWYSDVSHMAVYLGNDRIVEAVRPLVRTASLWVHGTPLPTVVRPFPG
jgi:putative cell wall-binding protein/cell wall-associated NlpC family hydrolase